jgi:hypothetical protein
MLNNAISACQDDTTSIVESLNLGKNLSLGIGFLARVG